MTELIKALVKFQKNMGGIKKTADNPFYKKKYADLYAYISAANPGLIENGLTITQTIVLDNGVPILVTTLWHESGQFLNSHYPLKPLDDPQKMGIQITYFRRYCYAAILGLAAEDDDAQSIAQSLSGETKKGQARKPIQTGTIPFEKKAEDSIKVVCPNCKKTEFSMTDKFMVGVYYCNKDKGGCGNKWNVTSDIPDRQVDPQFGRPLA